MNVIGSLKHEGVTLMHNEIRGIGFAVIDQEAGTATLVAATAGKAIRVRGFLMSTGAIGCTAVFKSGTAALTGTITIPANTVIRDGSIDGLFQTAVGEALNLTTGTAGVDGYLVYEMI